MFKLWMQAHAVDYLIKIFMTTVLLAYCYCMIVFMMWLVEQPSIWLKGLAGMTSLVIAVSIYECIKPRK